VSHLDSTAGHKRRKLSLRSLRGTLPCALIPFTVPAMAQDVPSSMNGAESASTSGRVFDISKKDVQGEVLKNRSEGHSGLDAKHRPASPEGASLPARS
jgi:hypothetical protein